MNTLASKLSVALGLILAVVSFPFIVNASIDWCGYRSFCASSPSFAIMIAFVIALIIGIVVGSACRVFVKRFFYD